jgi:2-polyprenyl-3-methyl-5-hydroxy-6-metoxy-1,4-benzoquinol methylase
MNEKCKICNCIITPIFNSYVLNKYNVDYFKCYQCGFIQTENPYWLEDAYSDAITKLDIGLIFRNIKFSNIIENYFRNNLFSSNGIYVDFGGGYGTFVRMMRDKGYDFYRHDIFCENIFAKHFDISDLPENNNFDLLTAFEVFEHLENPIDELKKMLLLSDIIIFSTLLLPNDHVTPENWWYFIPETGQHISLFSLKTLEVISKTLNLHFYSNERDIHIFSKNKLKYNPFFIKNISFFEKIKNRLIKKNKKINNLSLLNSDFDFVRNKLKNEIIIR